METVMTTFGVRNSDGSVSDIARKRIIDYHQQFSQIGKINLNFECVPNIKPDPFYNPNLANKDLYPDWHKRWIDDVFSSLLDTLDRSINQRSFLIKVFDPTGVADVLSRPKIDLGLAGMIGAFAMPIPVVANLLLVPPPEVIAFNSNLIGLINPQPTTITGKPPQGQENFASLQEFNSKFIIGAVPQIFSKLISVIGKENWWLNFTPEKLFKASCQIVQEITKNLLLDPGDNFAEYQTNLATIKTVTADIIAVSAAHVVVGATNLIKILGNYRGYIKYNEPKMSEDQEAALNNLVRLQDNGSKLTVNFTKRKAYYGDSFTVETIQKMAEHMSFTDNIQGSKNPISLKDNTNSFFKLEVGNITRKEPAGGLGWRYNQWSHSHGGASFDTAYPMKQDGKWLSGIENNLISQNMEEGLPGETPYRCGNSSSNKYGSPNIPFLIPGQQPDYLKKAYADAQIGEGQVLPHDFAAMYEMARWLFHDWIPELIQKNIIVQELTTGNNPPFGGILVGENIFKVFNAWCKHNFGELWNFEHQALYKKLKWGSVTPMFFKYVSHEDHMHFVGNRTDIIGINDTKNIYLCHHHPEGNYENYPGPSSKDHYRYKPVTITLSDGEKYYARK